MKKKKILGLCTIVAIATLSLASCDKTNDNQNNNDANIEENNDANFEEKIKYRFDEMIDTRSNPDIDMTVSYSSEYTFRSISADTNNMKTHYYVGEEFDATGLVVNALYSKFVDGNAVTKTNEVSNYYYSLDGVDLTQVGVYPVKITYREGATVRTTTFNITVTNSLLDDLKVEYLAGIEPVDSIVEIKKNSTFKLSEKNFKMHYFNNANETKTLDMTSDEFAKLTIDYSKLNTARTGQYVVSYSYDTSVIDNDNVTHNYKLTGFVVVSVK